jgi:hypothetical protein
MACDFCCTSGGTCPLCGGKAAKNKPKIKRLTDRHAYAARVLNGRDRDTFDQACGGGRRVLRHKI